MSSKKLTVTWIRVRTSEALVRQAGIERTSDTVFIRRLDLCKNHLGSERPEHDQSERDCSVFKTARLCNTDGRTLIVQTPVPIADLALTRLGKIKDADAQTNVVQDAVRVLLVQLGYERTRDRHPKVVRLDRYRVLRSASATHAQARGGRSP
jgi:hypothetical protein